MKHIKIVIICILTILGIAIYGGGSLSAMSDTPATVQAADGCSACHPKLSQQVPETHFKATTDRAENCLGCHTVAAAAPAFAWTIHKSHYANLGEAANCSLCHENDAKGNFKVTGVDRDLGLTVPIATADKMQKYYLSAATSAFQDNKHNAESVTCVQCHGTAFPTAAPKKEQCFVCHGTYEQLAEQSTFHYEPMFPHFQADAVECADCHKGHEKSVLACNQCHSFGEEVP